jgi:hypothetical protein
MHNEVSCDRYVIAVEVVERVIQRYDRTGWNTKTCDGHTKHADFVLFQLSNHIGWGRRRLIFCLRDFRPQRQEMPNVLGRSHRRQRLKSRVGMFRRYGELDLLSPLAVQLPLVVSWSGRCGGPLLHGASPLRAGVSSRWSGYDEAPSDPR